MLQSENTRANYCFIGSALFCFHNVLYTKTFCSQTKSCDAVQTTDTSGLLLKQLRFLH